MCLYVNVSMCTCVCEDVSMHVHKCKWMRVCVCVCAFECMCLCICAWMWVRVHEDACGCRWVFTFACEGVCVCLCRDMGESVCVCVCVTYWPSIEPSIKRCTSVNKRKNSGSACASNKNTIRTQTAWVSWGWSQLGTRCRIESQLQREGFGSSVTLGWATTAKMRKKCCYGQKNLGSIYSCLSPSPAHPSHTTNINPFEDKVGEIYFY